MPTELARVRVMGEGHDFPKSGSRGSKWFEPLNQTCVKIEKVFQIFRRKQICLQTLLVYMDLEACNRYIRRIESDSPSIMDKCASPKLRVAPQKFLRASCDIPHLIG